MFTPPKGVFSIAQTKFSISEKCVKHKYLVLSSGLDIPGINDPFASVKILQNPFGFFFDSFVT